MPPQPKSRRAAAYEINAGRGGKGREVGRAWPTENAEWPSLPATGAAAQKPAMLATARRQSTARMMLLMMMVIGRLARVTNGGQDHVE